ncbi:MAG: efflux RND transporter permease subunit, partial [Candidatus Cloacimonetes bacterium]|nr:efflux RND transporter permease subunit [Candidatus Cloacimonadota bacterium]
SDVSKMGPASIKIYFPEKVLQTAYPFVLREKLIAQSKYYGGIDVRIFGLGPVFSGGGSYIYYKSFELAGYNYYKLNELTRRLADYMKKNPRIQKVRVNSRYGRNVKQVCINIKKNEIERFKIKPFQINMQLYYFFNKNIAGKIISPEDEYDIKIQPKQNIDLNELKNYLIKIGNKKVKLSAIADIELEDSPYRITRKNQQYLSRIEYEYRGSYKMHQDFREAVEKNTKLPAGYKFVEEDTDFSGFNKLIENQKQLFFILGLTIVLVFIILAMLFESYLQPFIIMMSIPLAFVGVSFAFAIFDITFDSSAFIGTLLLCGIVVNNSIILVNRINQIRGENNNSNINKIIIQAAKERAKPILITSMTTIFGLMPFILYTQESSSESIWRTLAFATVGGLTTSTLFTLFLTPVFYNFLDKLKHITYKGKR